MRATGTMAFFCIVSPFLLVVAVALFACIYSGSFRMHENVCIYNLFGHFPISVCWQNIFDSAHHIALPDFVPVRCWRMERSVNIHPCQAMKQLDIE